MSTWKLFSPILPGASLRDRCLGIAQALAAIALTAVACGYLWGGAEALPLIVAPMGASAVLLFAVPTSPLAQPWPVIGGNTISAAVGLACAMIMPDPAIAAGLAVALAIAAMSVTRSLHPPGGAVALTAVLGGPLVDGPGLLFPFFPVAANSVAMVVLAIALHRTFGRNYPHRPVPERNPHGTSDPLPARRLGFTAADLDAALEEAGEAFDVSRQDLEQFLHRVEASVLARSKPLLLCGDIMSRDVVSVPVDADLAEAEALLLEHGWRTLPVVGEGRRVLGTVGLRELAAARRAGRADLSEILSPAHLAAAGDPVFRLLPPLLDGRSHAVIVVDAEGILAGLVTQTDLLATLSRVAATNDNALIPLRKHG